MKLFNIAQTSGTHVTYIDQHADIQTYIQDTNIDIALINL